MNQAVNIHAGIGAGRFRQPWRIREYLSGIGISMADVARAIGISRVVVSATVRGRGNNRKTLRYLADLGCPIEYLSLPTDMQ
jgi:transcriptional regulator with XRE-family HTH domain